MSTAINITVDDGGLPARNRQQVAANRQAFVQNVTAEQSTALGLTQRSQDRIDQGRDPATGALLIPPSLTGALRSFGGNIPRLNQQPAANRKINPLDQWIFDYKPPFRYEPNGAGDGFDIIYFDTVTAKKDIVPYAVIGARSDNFPGYKLSIGNDQYGRFITAADYVRILLGQGYSDVPYKTYGSVSVEVQMYMEYKRTPDFVPGGHSIELTVGPDKGFIFIMIVGETKVELARLQALSGLAVIGSSEVENFMPATDNPFKLKITCTNNGKVSAFINNAQILNLNTGDPYPRSNYSVGYPYGTIQTFAQNADAGTRSSPTKMGTATFTFT